MNKHGLIPVMRVFIVFVQYAMSYWIRCAVGAVWTDTQHSRCSGVFNAIVTPKRHCLGTVQNHHAMLTTGLLLL
jgi:hypothetical protein